MKIAFRSLALRAVVLIAATTVPAQALTITLNQIAAGTVIPGTGVTATAQPGGTFGGGNLATVMATGAQFWQADILDNFTLTVNFGWGNAGGGGTLAFEQTQNRSAGPPVRNLTTSIVVDSVTNTNWFIDNTPSDNSEFSAFGQLFDPLGTAGNINTGRVYSGATGTVAADFDLLSVVTHELGHALGLDVGYAGYTGQVTGANTLVVTAATSAANAGATIPVVSAANAHIDPSRFNSGGSLMQSNIGVGVRRVPSTEDILAVCQASSFTGCTNGVSAVPEPGTAWLLLTSAVGIFAFRRFRRTV